MGNGGCPSACAQGVVKALLNTGQARCQRPGILSPGRPGDLRCLAAVAVQALWGKHGLASEWALRGVAA